MSPLVGLFAGVPPVSTTLAVPVSSVIVKVLVTVCVPNPDSDATDVVLVYVIEFAFELLNRNTADEDAAGALPVIVFPSTNWSLRMPTYTLLWEPVLIPVHVTVAPVPTVVNVLAVTVQLPPPGSA
jgi:hypothetical protein